MLNSVSSELLSVRAARDGSEEFLSFSELCIALKLDRMMLKGSESMAQGLGRYRAEMAAENKDGQSITSMRMTKS